MAFKELVSENKTAKICLFIDGLDEHDGDSDDIITLVKELSPFQNVKICVSSRPWTEFVLEFSINEARLLKMEDLTAEDIRSYVNDFFMRNGRFRKYAAQENGAMSQIKEEILQKSAGVFLWVYLVVRSLLQGLKYADNAQLLWKRLRSFPPDLDDFFLHMLRG